MKWFSTHTFLTKWSDKPVYDSIQDIWYPQILSLFGNLWGEGVTTSWLFLVYFFVLLADFFSLCILFSCLSFLHPLLGV